MSLQEIFNLCASHLLKQNAKSQSDNGSCCYRLVQDDGTVLKCGAAPLLNEDYLAEHGEDKIPTATGDFHILNNASIYAVSTHCPQAFKEEFQSLTKEQLEFVSEIQRIHDNHPPRDWTFFLFRLASRHKLDSSVLEEK